MTTDQKINSLKNGQSIELSRAGDTWVLVEKSGKGDVIRFVRCTRNTQKVFKTIAVNRMIR